MTSSSHLSVRNVPVIHGKYYIAYTFHKKGYSPFKFLFAQYLFFQEEIWSFQVLMPLSQWLVSGFSSSFWIFVLLSNVLLSNYCMFFSLGDCILLLISLCLFCSTISQSPLCYNIAYEYYIFLSSVIFILCKAQTYLCLHLTFSFAREESIFCF